MMPRHEPEPEVITWLTPDGRIDLERSLNAKPTPRPQTQQPTPAEEAAKPAVCSHRFQLGPTEYDQATGASRTPAVCSKCGAIKVYTQPATPGAGRLELGHRLDMVHVLARRR